MKIKAWQKMFCLVSYCKLTFICAWKFFVRFAWPLSSWIFYAVDQSWNMSSIFVASSSWSQKLVNTNQFIFGRSWNKISKNWYMLITNIYRRLFLLLYFDLFICNLMKIRLRNIWLIGILYCRCLVLIILSYTFKRKDDLDYTKCESSSLTDSYMYVIWRPRKVA